MRVYFLCAFCVFRFDVLCVLCFLSFFFTLFISVYVFFFLAGGMGPARVLPSIGSTRSRQRTERGGEGGSAGVYAFTTALNITLLLIQSDF